MKNECKKPSSETADCLQNQISDWYREEESAICSMLRMENYDTFIDYKY